MDITFDIARDELPIFLAEADEHLQLLDNNLLLLQGNDADADLIQTVFRSAHTIKGMAGMIGHQRMTRVTHALENALDGVRKNTVQISSQLIDLCLKAVDCLRSLREEVQTSTVSEIDIEDVVSALRQIAEGANESKPEETIMPQPEDVDLNGSVLQICAKIDTNSMASAARAFQLMMVLQDMGDIRWMSPSQDAIESASSVREFAATLATAQQVDHVGAALMKISGVDEISINGRIILANESTSRADLKTKNNGVQPPVQKEAESSPTPRERRNESNSRRISDMTLRMNIEHMDNLMNLVGELITDRNHLQQIRAQIAADTNPDIHLDQLFETVTHLGRITDQLQEQVMSIRVLPIGSMFNRFPRMVHDMSHKVGKNINLVLHGEDTEMDRSMIDAVYDPLIHLIRNSVDHGIEMPQDRLASGKPQTGTIILAARHEQGRIIVKVEDDGRGIDGEKLKMKAVQKGLIRAEEAEALTAQQSIDLMFLAGLSTVEEATEFSGRGVGLDIVKTNIQRVNGSLQVESHPGQGTQFQISLPLTLAIVPSLLVRVQQVTFALPMFMITETLRLTGAEIKYVDRKPVTVLRGKVLPLVSVSDVFCLAETEQERKYLFAAVIQSGQQQVGLIVDSLIGEEEVVVKPLGSYVGDIPGISSATILGNGQVALIVDVLSFFNMIGI